MNFVDHGDGFGMNILVAAIGVDKLEKRSPIPTYQSLVSFQWVVYVCPRRSVWATHLLKEVHMREVQDRHYSQEKAAHASNTAGESTLRSCSAGEHQNLIGNYFCDRPVNGKDVKI